MGLFSRNGTQPSAQVASAAGVARQGEDIQRVRQDWQDRALGYYDIVPEVWFASQFYARGLSKLRLFPALRDDEDEVSPADDPDLTELWDRVQDPQGGRGEMFKSYGRLMFLNGESYLLATAPEGEEIWEIVSTREVTVQSDQTITRRKGEGGKQEVYQPLDAGADNIGRDQAIVYRMWRRHPRRSWMADAPLRASLDICEELVLLTLGIRARIRSRLSGAGILAIDSDVTLPASDELDESDEDAFIRKLGEHLMEPIGDEGSASAVVPYLLRIPTAGRKIDDLITHIRVNMPNEEFPERGMREEAVKRLATGLDLPPELLLGLAAANHWTSWQIDEQSWELLQPTVQQLCDDFAGAYLRPAAEDMGFTDWERVTLGYDKSEIVIGPDRSTDAAQAHDRLIISDQAYRESTGWAEDTAPSDEELQVRLAVKMGKPELLPEDLGGPSQQEQPPAAPPEAPPNPSNQPPKVTEPPPEDRGKASAWFSGAAEFAIERARELAGSRIRTRTKSCGPCQNAIDGYPNSLVASVLGPESTHLAGTEQELVQGAGVSFARLLVRRGIEAHVASSFGRMVEDHAAETLYLAEPPPLPLEEALA